MIRKENIDKSSSAKQFSKGHTRKPASARPKHREANRSDKIIAGINLNINEQIRKEKLLQKNK